MAGNVVAVLWESWNWTVEDEPGAVGYKLVDGAGMELGALALDHAPPRGTGEWFVYPGDGGRAVTYKRESWARKRLLRDIARELDAELIVVKGVE